MTRVAEPWEPFDIEVLIEGKTEKILVIPDPDEAKYQLFDDHTPIGNVWTEQRGTDTVWCAEGMIARELLEQAGEQIEQNRKWLLEEGEGLNPQGSGIVPGDQLQGSDADQDSGTEGNNGLIQDKDIRGSDADIDR